MSATLWNSCPRPSGKIPPRSGSESRWAMPGEFDEIRSRLETIAEELGDLAIQRLRESIDAGGDEVPVDERPAGRVPRWLSAPTQGARCTWWQRAWMSATPWRSWPRPSEKIRPRPGSESRWAMPGEFDEIRSRLEAIAEELADLAIERLRESIDVGGDELPVDERRLTRARRAVEKAAYLLEEPDDNQ